VFTPPDRANNMYTETKAFSEHTRQSAVWDVYNGGKNFAVLVMAQIAGAVFSFFATWLTTRFLGADGYGVIAAVLAASQVVALITVEWTSVALWRYGCEEFVDSGRLAKAFWARSILLVPNVLLVVVTSVWWLAPIANWLEIPPKAQALVLVHFLMMTLWVHVQRALQAAKLPHTQGYLLASERLLLVALIGSLVVAGRTSVISIGLSYVVAPFLATIAGIWQLRSLIFPTVWLNPALLKSIMAFSLPLIPYFLLASLSGNQLDAFFITHYLSVTAFGVYSLAYTLSGILMQLPTHLGSLLLPFFITVHVHGETDRVSHFLRDLLPPLTLLWSTGCALFAAINWYLLPLIFGPQFQGARAVLWPLMAAAALRGPWLMGFSPASTLKSATYVATLASLISALSNVALNFLLIPTFGLIGCAWATTAAYAGATLIGARLTDGLLPSRSWAIEATLPALLGAAYASWRFDNAGALAVSILAGAFIALRRRADILAGVRSLANAGVLSPVLKASA
jgi:O-antigen/teichoic acid export membrane protein